MREQVAKAMCLECDWEHYAFTGVQAREWADTHAAEKGHLVSLAVPRTTI